MTPDERRSHANWLRGLGVPPQFHDEIIDAPAKEMIAEPGAVKGFPTGAAVAVLALYGFFGLIIGGFFFVRHVNARAVAEAAKVDAALIHLNLGIGFTVLVFAMVLWLAWIGADGSRRYRVNGALVDAAKALQPPPEEATFEARIAYSLTRVLLRAAVHRAKNEATADQFLLAVSGFSARLIWYPAALFTAAGVCVTALETNSFWFAGTAGIVEYRMFPPFSVRRYDLAEVTMLETGCSYSSGGRRSGSERRLHYTLHYANDVGFGLARARAIEGKKLEAIERIDAMLAPEVPHIRWQWLDNNPLHSTCFAYWAGEFTANGTQRLAKLLRLTPQETRDLGLP